MADSHNRSKRYFELYAALSLTYFGIPFEKLRQDESPDWQSEELDLGIEVRRGISEEQGRFYSKIAGYLEQGLNELQIEQKIEAGNAMQKFPYYKQVVEGTDTVFFSHYRDSFSMHYDRLLHSITDKLGKLNRHYRVFGKNALYIFSDTSLHTPKRLQEFLSGIGFSSYPVIFDAFYINCMTRIYCFETKTNCIAEKRVTATELMLIHKQAADLAASK